MSIINNVLRDLESKPNAFAPLDATSIVIEKPADSKFSLYWVTALGLLTALVLFGYLNEFNLFQLDGYDNRTFQQKRDLAVADNVRHDIGQPLAKAQAVKKNQISGLQIKETAQYMKLSFQLLSKGEVFLKQRAKNRYVFLIRDTSSMIDAPQLSHNPWIYQLSIKNDNEGLQLQFDIHQGVLVETADVVEAGQNYWLIKLKKPIAEKTIFKESLKPVKAQKPEKVNKPTSVESIQAASKDANNTETTKADVTLKIKSATGKLSELQRLNQAVEEMHSRQWRKAELMFNGLLGGKQDRQARSYLLQLFQQQQKHSLREALLLESLSLYPEEKRFRYMHANQLFVEKRYDELIRNYAEKADAVNMSILLGASYQRTNRHDLAVRHYIKALQKDSRQPKLWISLGISQHKLGRTQDALKSYQTAQASGNINDRLKAFLQQQIPLLSD